MRDERCNDIGAACLPACPALDWLYLASQSIFNDVGHKLAVDGDGFPLEPLGIGDFGKMGCGERDVVLNREMANPERMGGPLICDPVSTLQLEGVEHVAGPDSQSRANPPLKNISMTVLRGVGGIQSRCVNPFP